MNRQAVYICLFILIFVGFLNYLILSCLSDNSINESPCGVIESKDPNVVSGERKSKEIEQASPYSSARDVFGTEASGVSLEEKVRNRPGTASMTDLKESVCGIVRNSEGNPIENAKVKVIALQGGGEIRTETLTNSVGQYVLGPLPAGWVLIESWQSGYYRSHEWGKVGGEVDFELGTAGHLEGRVTLLSSGKPVIDASIYVYEQLINEFSLRRIAGEFMPRETAKTRTDGEGHYSITDLKPGKYKVAVFPSDNSPRFSGKFDTIIREGNTTTKDVILVGSNGITVHGVVSDPETRDVVKGASVCLSSNPRQCCTTDKFGKYEIRGVASETKRGSLVVKADGYKDMRVRFVITLGHDLKMDIELRKPITVSGKVTNGNGEPIVGALVATSIEYMNPLLRRNAARTDEDGIYRLTDVIDGETYTIYAVADGFAIGCSAPFIAKREVIDGAPRLILRKGGQVKGRVLNEKGVPVNVGSLRLVDWTSEGIKYGWRSRSVRTCKIMESGKFDFVNVPCGSYSFEYHEGEANRRIRKEIIAVNEESITNIDLKIVDGGRISGRVTRSDGTPLENRIVCAVSYGPAGYRGETRTKSDGTFVIEGLGFAKYEVGLFRGEGESTKRFKDVEIGSEIDIVVSQTPIVSGVVIKPNGVHSPLFWIKIRTTKERICAGTLRVRFNDPEGRFELKPGIARSFVNGEWAIQAGDDEGRRSKWFRFNVVEGRIRDSFGKEIHKVVLQLKECAVVEGQVVKADRKPVSRAIVTISSLRPDISDALIVTQADSRGMYRFEGLAKGEYRIRASQKKLRTAIEGLVIGDTGRYQRDLTLESGCKYCFVVLGPHGAPLENAKVTVETIRQKREKGIDRSRYCGFLDERKAANTDKEGRAIIHGLGVGEYEITTTHRSWIGNIASLRIVEDKGTNTKEIQIGSGGMIEVEVVDQRGAAIAGAKVELRTQCGDRRVEMDEKRYFKLYEKEMKWREHVYWEEFKKQVSTTGDNGRLVRLYVPTGVFKVIARIDGREVGARENITVRENEKESVVIVLEKGVR